MCDNNTILTLYSTFKGDYNNWCAKNNFESKLPKTVKARTAAASKDAKQTQLDPHLQERVPKTRVIPYSDELFRQVAIEWLVATDQVRVFLFFVCLSDHLLAYSSTRECKIQGDDRCCISSQGWRQYPNAKGNT